MNYQTDNSGINNPIGMTVITYYNASFTEVNITVNGVIKTISAGGNVQYFGLPGTPAIAAAYTFGKSASGATIGETVSWSLKNSFPITGNLNDTLNVESKFFFLRIKNTSAESITKLYVNFSVPNQTIEAVKIENNYKVYDLDYYYNKNTDIRAENRSAYWYFKSLLSDNSLNQTTTLITN